MMKKEMTLTPAIVSLLGAAILSALLMGCGTVCIPSLNPGERFTVQLDKASAIVENDMKPSARKGREDSLRGS